MDPTFEQWMAQYHPGESDSKQMRAAYAAWLADAPRDSDGRIINDFE